MQHISGHRCEQVLHVQVLLYEMQELAFLTKIHVHHNQNSSWQWTICRCLFVIPVILTIQSNRFEIFTLVSEIHEDVDLVIGIKNLFELEGIIDSQDSCIKFLNRSIPFFPKEEVTVKPGEQKVLTLEAPFMEEISGMAITKMLDIKEQKTLTMKLKFIRNRAILK